MGAKTGAVILVVLVAFLGVLTLANAIILSIAHADLDKNKSLITSGSTLAAAQHALFIDVIIAWVVVAVYLVLAGIVAGVVALLIATGAAEVAALSFAKSSKLGALLVVAGVALLVFGLIVGFEGYYAAVAARGIIKSVSFTGSGSLSTSYWLSFISAALGLGTLFLILVAFASIVSTWMIEKRAGKIFAHLAAEAADAAEEAKAAAAVAAREAQEQLRKGVAAARAAKEAAAARLAAYRAPAPEATPAEAKAETPAAKAEAPAAKVETPAATAEAPAA